MKKVLPLAVAAAVMAMAAGSANAQTYGDDTRRTNQQYSDTLRKGKAAPVTETRRVLRQRIATIPLEDQFPCQGTDNPSGLPSNCDWNDESGPQEDFIRSHIPISGSNQVGELDPQEAPPGYLRGPIYD